MDKFSPTVQLFLPVRTRLEKSFDTFYGYLNQQLVAMIKQHIQLGNETLIMLVGAQDVGKTHLLSAAVSFFESLNQSDLESAYFSMPELMQTFPSQDQLDELLSYFETFALLALDDLDVWLENLQDPQRVEAELLIFNLFNHYKMNGKQLLIASKCPPSRLNIELKDLRSRLSSGLLLTLSELSEQEKSELIQSSARLKGFMLDEDVSSFILKKSGRDLPTLLSVIETLDKATLTLKRRLTVPLVKKVFNW